jgi:serine/threonine-protein kinase
MTAAADCHLLFGLLALQNGLIDQGQLVLAFQAWTRDKSKGLADQLVARGDLDADACAGLKAMVALHVKKYGDVERSLAAVPANRSTRAGLAALGEPEIEATLARVARSKFGQATEVDGDDDPDRTAGLSVGAATSDGQRFRVLRPHARGGLGEVFVALDAELHREVALKQILEKHADDLESRQRFVAEAEITGGLEHPGVVPVYGLGTYAGGRPYYAMRFIRGDSLKEAIGRFHADDTQKSNPGGRSLELRKLLRRFLDVCNAIDYAHSRGVIHRDIKPANIILGKHGETLVVDWGLAKAVGRADPSVGEQTIAPSSSGSSETLPGSALGTPAYMSPEQARGELDRLGPRSDVYSLGATLYCLLAGKPPLEGEDIGEILRRVQAGDFRAPREVDPSLDRALEAVCTKAMAMKLEDRYASGRALAEDIERWAADEPVTAYREPLSRRARRWAKRNRTLVATAAVALVAGVVGLSVVLFVQTQARAEVGRALGRETRANAALAAANLDLRESNVRERVSREQAQRRFDLARQAIEQYYTGASKDVLLKRPELEALRKTLLGTAMAFYKRLQAELEGAQDPATRAELASAFKRVGQITDEVGTKAESLEAYQRARAIHEELVRADPSAAGPRRELAGDLEWIGGLLTMVSGREDEALPLLERALALRAALADDAANVRATAETYLVIASNRMLVGRAAEGLRAVEASKEVAERLVADHPGDDAARQTLSGVWSKLADFQMRLGRYDAVRHSLEQALALQEQLAARHPEEPRYRSKLAGTLDSASTVIFNMGHPNESLPYTTRARALFQRLAADFPTNTEYRYSVARQDVGLGSRLEVLGRHEEAQRALELGESTLERLAADHPGVTKYAEDQAYSLGNLANALRALGRPAEARRALDRARAIYERQPPGPITLYNLACTCSILAALAEGDEGRAYADLAMAALRRSVDAGYRRIPMLRSDRDLDSLRSRADFQILLLDVAFPNDPFARSD